MNFSTYTDFEDAKLKCRECSVGGVYDTVVPSFGCKSIADVFVLGEAPGAEEIQKLQPFVGKAGKCLRSVLNKNGFRQQNTLISNVIPCRPENNKFPKDATLVRKCFNKWLRNEILLLQPSYMLLLGNQPLQFIFGT